MSEQRRSSSPLSSASPSPVQEPTVNGDPPPDALHLGPAADLLDNANDDEGDLIGGSSPTTLTEPLTDSELTDDEDDVEDAAQHPDGAADAAGLDAPAAEPDVPVPDDTGDDTPISKRPTTKRQASPSPSLTPPPPSDPPRSDALPSSPLDKEGDDEDEPMVEDAAEGDGEPVTADTVKEEALPPNHEEADVDGDVTMRADDPDETADDIEGTNTATVTENEVDADDVAEPEEPVVEEEVAVEVEAEDSTSAAPSRASGHHSSHAPGPSTAAVRAMVALEVKFAALRDRLYVERLEEAAKEEEMILNGTHPALLHLNKIVEARRERLHEIALRRYEESLSDLKIWRDVETKISWQTWTDQRDQLHWEEFEQTWSKRRRLAREKNEIETPKVQRPVPKVEKPPKPFDWSPGPVPSRLTTEEGLADLSAIDVARQQQQQLSRHASPAMYGGYAGPSTSAYGYQAASQHAASHLHVDDDPRRRHHFNVPAPAPRQQHRQTQPSVQAETSAPPRPMASTSTLPQPALSRKTIGAEAFSVPRRDVLPHTNGDKQHINGHSQQQPAGALGLSASGSSALSDVKPSISGPPGGSGERANASSRFPGLADYLSGSATPPQNSFQHHLLNSSSSQQSGSKGAPAPPSMSSAAGAPGTLSSSSLARPFPQPTAPQPRTANVARN